VLARDQFGYGSILVSIDGRSIYIGITYRVTLGSHQICAPGYIYYGGWWVDLFQSYYYNGAYDYNNPTTITITSDMTVTAYYYAYPVP
jgi:hypothetical protein